MLTSKYIDTTKSHLLSKIIKQKIAHNILIKLTVK